MAQKKVPENIIALIYRLRQDPDKKLSQSEVLNEVKRQISEGLVDAGDYNWKKMTTGPVEKYGGPAQEWQTTGYISKTRSDYIQKQIERETKYEDADVVRHYNKGLGKDDPIDMSEEGWRDLITTRMRLNYGSGERRKVSGEIETRQVTYDGKKRRIRKLFKNIDGSLTDEFWPKGSNFGDVINSESFRNKYGELAQDSGLYELENAAKASEKAHKVIGIFEELLRNEYSDKIPGRELPVYTTDTPEDIAKLLETAERLAIRTLDYQIERAGVRAKMLLMNPREMETLANEIFRYKLEDLLSGQRRHLSHYVALNDDGTYGLTMRANLFVGPSKKNIARGPKPISDRVTGEILDLDAQNLFDTSSFRLPNDYAEGLISQPRTHEGVFPDFGTDDMALTNQQIPWIKHDPKARSLALDRATQAGHNTMFQQKLNEINRMVGPESGTPLGKQSSGSVTSQGGATRISPQLQPLNWWDRGGVAIKKRKKPGRDLRTRVAGHSPSSASVRALFGTKLR